VKNVVYLHGFASGPSSRKAAQFQSVFRKAGVNVSVPDLAGGDFENLTISGQLRVLHGAAGDLPVRLIGSSMGGYVAALYASEHATVERLVLLAPAFGFFERWPQNLGPDRFAEWRRTGYLETYHYGEQRLRRVSYRLYEDAQQYPAQPKVIQPTLIFHGRRDDVVPVQNSSQFAAQNPNTTLQVVDSDHELLDSLDEICRRALEFLTGTTMQNPKRSPGTSNE
jgi:pimeloyl-ACP methyl ester carboxylesterase